MEKLNTLGLKLQSLKSELLKPDYPEVVKEALRGHADKLAETDIGVDLHVSLTDKKITIEEFTDILLETKYCLKTPEEMLVEFEKIRASLHLLLNGETDEPLIPSTSLVEEEKIVFTRTFKLDKQWVSEYFGQPPEEVGKLMIRNGFVEKFAVLRLSKIFDDFLKSSDFKKDKTVKCKITQVFYNVEQGFYGINLIFYVQIEDAEDEEKASNILEYIQETNRKAEAMFSVRMMV